MAKSLNDFGSIVEDFTDSLNEYLGTSPKGNAYPGAKAELQLNYKGRSGVQGLVKENWSGNVKREGVAILKYGFSILEAKNGLLSTQQKFGADDKDTFWLQTAPQSINQKELFSTNIQATRKGVIVESEGIVFKDLVISGTTGIFPGKRGQFSNALPNFNDPTQAPGKNVAVNEEGLSSANGSTTLSGYAEFILLREFFAEYSKRKTAVETQGKVFMVWLNQKDNQYLLVEPLEFEMRRDARQPLNYNYNIVLKVIAKLDEVISGDTIEEKKDGISTLSKISNVAANVTATLELARFVANESRATLENISQTIDATFITPLEQMELALGSIVDAVNTALVLPAALIGNTVSPLKRAVARAKAGLDTAQNNFALSQKAVTSLLGNTVGKERGIILNSLGQITDAPKPSGSNTTAQDAATINGRTPSILTEDGELSTVLTPAQFTAVKEIMDSLENDPNVPIPRSFVETLRANTFTLMNNLADSINAGDGSFNEIYAREVTQQAAPTVVPTEDQYRLLNTLQQVIKGMDKILSNSEFFESGSEQAYNQAQNKYGATHTVSRSSSAREISVRMGDTLQKIAAREYGDAGRWIDLKIINKLKAPYIEDTIVKKEGVLRPGDKILVGV